jgi:hypothetical protein
VAVFISYFCPDVAASRAAYHAAEKAKRDTAAAAEEAAKEAATAKLEQELQSMDAWILLTVLK